MKTIKKPKATTILAFLCSGAALLLVSMWFSMASLNYTPETRWFPLLTSGWFVIGLIFSLPFCFLYAGFFLLLSRWVQLRFMWLAMVSISLVFIGLSIRSALPHQKLRLFIGDEAAKSVKIEHFYSGDTFNDGTFYYAILSCATNSIDLIQKHRPLQLKPGVPNTLIGGFKNVELPRTTHFYTDNHGSFLVHPNENKIYFIHHTLSIPVD